jgi:hypothetical protein
VRGNEKKEEESERYLFKENSKENHRHLARLLVAVEAVLWIRIRKYHLTGSESKIIVKIIIFHSKSKLSPII